MRKLFTYVLVSLLTMTVGYATINNGISLNNDKWDIHYENIQEHEVNALVNENAKISEDNSKLIYDVNLTMPGDVYSFTVDVVNDGNVDATLYHIDLGELTEQQKKYLEYNVTYLDGTELKINDILKANSKTTIKVELVFKTDITAEDLPTESEELDIKLDIDYAQSTINK